MLDTIISTIFTVLIIPVLGYFLLLLRQFFIGKINSIKIFNQQAENEAAKTYLYESYELIDAAITTAISEVEQTFVQQAKENGSWNKETMMQALELAKERVLEIGDNAALELVEHTTSALDAYIQSKIESLINKQKISTTTFCK